MKLPRATWFLILFWLFVAAIRFRLAGMPLERDEGEYAYMGQQMLRGVAPYGEAANMKWPGTYAFYALIEAIFGQSDVGIRVGLICVNAATGALLCAWAKSLFDAKTAFWSSLFFAIWSLSPSLLGIIGHATHFVSLCATGAIFLLDRAQKEQKLSWFFVSGALFGLAALMKQHGALFLLPALILCVCGEKIGFASRFKRAALLFCGALFPVALTFLTLWKAEVWSKFWFWTVDYARFYATATPSSLVLRNLEANTGDFARDAALWGLAFLGFYGLWRRGLNYRGEMTLWISFAFAMTIPGFFFRPHYFLPAIPFLSLLAALFVREMGEILRENQARRPDLTPQLFGITSLVVTLFFHRGVLFQLSPDAASRRVYRGEMFVETKEIGLKLRSEMAPNAKLAIFGSEPQIAFYARRRLASEFLYTYNLVEPQPFASQMQRTMAAQIQQNAPQFLVEMQSERSWIIWPQSDPFIFSWLNAYKKSFKLQNQLQIVDPATEKPNILRVWKRQRAK